MYVSNPYATDSEPSGQIFHQKYAETADQIIKGSGYSQKIKAKRLKMIK